MLLRPPRGPLPIHCLCLHRDDEIPREHERDGGHGGCRGGGGGGDDEDDDDERPLQTHRLLQKGISGELIRGGLPPTAS